MSSRLNEFNTGTTLTEAKLEGEFDNIYNNKVDGPVGASTDNAIPRFDGTGGITLQDSNVVIDNSDAITGITDLTATGNISCDILTANTAEISAGNVTANITGNVTGNVTGDLTGNVTGNLTGDVTGNVSGILTGDVTGNVTGVLTGNVTGNLTGNISSNCVVTGSIFATGHSSGCRTVNSAAVLGGFALSSTSSGAASASNSSAFTDISNMSVSITTSGRPVVITVIPDTTSNESYVGTGAATEARFQFLRDSTSLGVIRMDGGSSHAYRSAPAALSTIDTPTAGTYTYKLQGKAGSGGSTVVYYCLLMAYEL